MLVGFGILLKSILKRLKMNNKKDFYIIFIPRYEQKFVTEV